MVSLLSLSRCEVVIGDLPGYVSLSLSGSEHGGICIRDDADVHVSSFSRPATSSPVCAWLISVLCTVYSNTNHMDSADPGPFEIRPVPVTEVQIENRSELLPCYTGDSEGAWAIDSSDGKPRGSTKLGFMEAWRIWSLPKDTLDAQKMLNKKNK